MHPRTGVAEDVRVEARVVASILFSALYSPLTASIVPALVDHAERNEFQSVFALGLAGEGTDENMSVGMQLSVLCSEDAVRVTPADMQQATAGTIFGSHLLGNQLKACEMWPKGEVDDSYYEPVVSDVPALVLSGDLDPVTPPTWGDAVVKSLSQGRHITVPATGHGVIGTACGVKLIQDFIDSAVVRLARHVVRRSVKRPPFFVTPAGPIPRPCAAATPMIRVEQLRKQFGTVTAVNGVSFAAENGAITGLLGPNGAGKTTTLRMLYAVMRPDSGSIRVDDVDAIAEPQDAQARLGVLPDGFGLYPRLTAREHLEYFGELHGISGAQLRQRTRELLDLLDMNAIADRRTAGFSHGERTKVALARALVHNPQNVLLDEPTNGLDVMSTRAVRTIVRRLKDEGRCVLFSSHVMQEVSALCDAIVVIAHGRVVARGTPDDLRTAHRPRQPRRRLRGARQHRAGSARVTVGRSLRQIVIVVRKEIKDSLRDRRALWSIVFSVSIGPVIIGFMMNRVADRQREAEQVRVPVVGMQHAPALVEWLRQQSGVEVVEGPENPEEAVRNQEEELTIIIPKNFAEKFNQSRPALLQIVADSSRNDARPTVERVRRLLQQYGAEIGSLRLIARGVSPAAARPIDLEDIEVSTAQQRAAQILTFIPMFIIMAGFVGGMQIATDSTAGERERGSLEPLLVNPAPAPGVRRRQMARRGADRHGEHGA